MEDYLITNAAEVSLLFCVVQEDSYILNSPHKFFFFPSEASLSSDLKLNC